MNNQSQIEHQNQVEKLLKRWQRTNNIVSTVIIGGLLLGILVGASGAVLKHFGLPEEIRQFLMQFIGVSGTMLYLGRYWLKRKRFLLDLSDEDKEVLERASRIAGKSERNIAARMPKERKDYQADSEKELLRASSHTQDDGNLLRAAAYRDDVRKEESLRISSISNKD